MLHHKAYLKDLKLQREEAKGDLRTARTASLLFQFDP